MKTILELLGNPPELMPGCGKHLTYAQRMEDCDRRQKRFHELLLQSPEVYKEFIRRNYKKRAIDVTEMEGQKPRDRG